MIVQTANKGAAHFIITQIDHAAISGEFAQHFGNDVFAALDPREPLVYVATHHDDGWDSVDSAPQLDPTTNLPYHLTQTPRQQLLITNKQSPDANEAHHPLSGLLSSMHTYGLYHGRYGLTDRIAIHTIEEPFRDQVEDLLTAEVARQEKLKKLLPDTLAKNDVIFHHYKQLQFFDMLALYIQTAQPDDVKEATFVQVPKAIGEDATIRASHDGTGTITLDPWPFDSEQLSVATRGRYMQPFPDGEAVADLAVYLYRLPVEVQTYTFRKK